MAILPHPLYCESKCMGGECMGGKSVWGRVYCDVTSTLYFLPTLVYTDCNYFTHISATESLYVYNYINFETEPVYVYISITFVVYLLYPTSFLSSIIYYIFSLLLSLYSSYLPLFI